MFAHEITLDRISTQLHEMMARMAELESGEQSPAVEVEVKAMHEKLDRLIQRGQELFELIEDYNETTYQNDLYEEDY